MLVLWNGYNIPVNELGKRLYLDSGTLTPMLKKLETKNLLQRLRDSVDGRNVLVMLTDESRKMREAAKAIPQTIFDETGIPEAEAEYMIDKLNEILSKVR